MAITPLGKIGLSENVSIIGRSLKDLEKYGSRGTGYIGKVLMSSGERPVLGRKIAMDLAKAHLILICGKRGGGKCVTGDTLITLEDGTVKPISELEHDNRKVLSMDSEMKIVAVPKSDFFKRTVNKILELKLRSGKKIKLTPEHPLLTISGWKPAQELTTGNRIAAPRIQAVFGNGFLKESEIKLLAYLIAEGHTARRTVWFTNADSTIVSDFRQAVKEFDSQLSVKSQGKFGYRVVNLNPEFEIIKEVRDKGRFAKGTVFKPQNTLRQCMKELGCYDLESHCKKIPEAVFSLPEQKISLFLNRIFSCDGTIYFDRNTQTWRIAYASVSEELIRQVQHLLSRFEIQCSLREKQHELNGKQFQSFELELKGINVELFLKKIGFFGKKEKRQKLALEDAINKKRNANLDTVPKEIWDFYRPENWAAIGKQKGFAFPKSMRESMHYSPTREKLLQIALLDKNEFVQKIASSDIFWDEIKEVNTLEGEFDVFDICVPENHNFIANDIIIHNSYSMAVMLEEFARLDPDVRARTTVICIDTVGIFWSIKIPNKENISELSEWDLKPQATNARVLVPKGREDFYREKQIPIDGSFTIKTSELEAVEWMALFRLTWRDPEGVLITRVIETLQEKMGTYYGIEEIIAAIKKDTESDALAKQALINRIKIAKTWGLLEKEGTRLREIAKPGAVTIIDVSAYRQAIGTEGIKDIIVALLGKKLFEERMLFRKEEEMKLIKGEKKESSMPVVWMFIDEAHMFMPKDEDNIALKVLLEWVRVGRQPGLSLCLATQRPERLHPDAVSQCDLFISHRLTAQPDINAVSVLRPSYMHQDFDKYYAEMPKSKGYAIILDDNTEKIWMIKIRPRFSWDAGTDASAFID